MFVVNVAPVVDHFGSPNVPKRVENGPFHTKDKQEQGRIDFSRTTFLHCVCLPCIALGILVVMDNDEWKHLYTLATPPTPFNAPLAPRSEYG